MYICVGTDACSVPYVLSQDSQQHHQLHSHHTASALSHLVGTQNPPKGPYSAPLSNTSLRRTTLYCASTQKIRDSLLRLTCWELLLRKAACSTRICKGCTSLNSPPQVSLSAVTMKCPLVYSIINDGPRQAAGLHLN